MKAVRLYKDGASEKLVYEDAPVPEIADNQVLVKVYATSINHLDQKMARGGIKGKSPVEFPWIPGFDFAGLIQSVGKKVSAFKEGDEVYGNCMGGSYAEYLAADIDKVVKKPTNLSFVEATSVPHVGETAWQAVHTHGNLKPCQNVLIHGAAGAVGAYALQFAKAASAYVYASVGTADIDFAKSMGADVVIDYKKEDFTQIAKDIDLVLDFVGGQTQQKSYQVMKKGGRLVSAVGITDSEEAEKHFVIAIPMVIEQSGSDLEIITRMIEDDKVKTNVASVYPLRDAILAWDNFFGTDVAQASRPNGKIVLEVVDDSNWEDIYGDDSNVTDNPLEKDDLTKQPLRSDWEEGE